MKRLLFTLLTLTLITACHKCPPERPEPRPDTTTSFDLCLFRPGDYGSANWRIPAILCLRDGTLLITCDKRKNNESDLPQDIDIVSRRSTDGGRTWSEPVTIAEGTGYKHGYGDAALVQCANLDVVCVFVGGNGLFASSEEDPQRSYVCRSSDGGQTWSEPEDITAQLWGSQATNSVCKNYRSSFFASGNGLRHTGGEYSGRIMFAAAMCRKGSNTLDNFVVYSDDHGHTWQVSDLAYSGGDEAKLVQLYDNRVLISVRQNGKRGYNISSDGGVSWGTQGRWNSLVTNACNGDIIGYNMPIGAGTVHVLLHSLPNSMQREDVTLFVSFDEGETWKDTMLLFDGPSVYSSLTLLPNGGLGVFLEQNPDGPCELWYKYIAPSDLLKKNH